MLSKILSLFFKKQKKEEVLFKEPSEEFKLKSREHFKNTLIKCATEEDFSILIDELSWSYIDDLGSDELVWEVARDIFKERGYSNSYEEKVSILFEKIQEDNK